MFMELMDTCLGKLLKRMKPNPFPEEVIGKVVVAVVKALDYLKTEFAVIHRGRCYHRLCIQDWKLMRCHIVHYERLICNVTTIKLTIHYFERF